MENLEKIKSLIANEPPEILRGLILTIAEDNERLRALIKKVEDEKARQRQAHLNIEEQIKVLRRKVFGRSKENREGAANEGKARDPRRG